MENKYEAVGDLGGRLERGSIREFSSNETVCIALIVAVVTEIYTRVKIHRPVCQKKKSLILLYENLKCKIQCDRCLATGGQVNELWCIHIMEYS